MITTREINVNLEKKGLKLRQVTTKNIDAGVRVEPPKEPIKPRGISTTTLPDVADIAEKKKRAEIMAEKKALKVKKSDAYIEDGKVVNQPPNKDAPIIGTMMTYDDDKMIKKLNMRHAFVEIDGLVQAVSRRELK